MFEAKDTRFSLKQNEKILFMDIIHRNDDLNDAIFVNIIKSEAFSQIIKIYLMNKKNKF